MQMLNASDAREKRGLCNGISIVLVSPVFSQFLGSGCCCVKPSDCSRSGYNDSSDLCQAARRLRRDALTAIRP